MQIIKTKQWRLELIGSKEEFESMFDEFQNYIEGNADNWVCFLTDSIQSMLSEK